MHISLASTGAYAWVSLILSTNSVFKICPKLGKSVQSSRLNLTELNFDATVLDNLEIFQDFKTFLVKNFRSKYRSGNHPQDRTLASLIGGSKGALGTRPPFFFNFMQFSGKNGQNIINRPAPPLGLTPHVWEILDPPRVCSI